MGHLLTENSTNFMHRLMLIHEIKFFFSNRLAYNLNLVPVEGPLIVSGGTGVNDYLNNEGSPVTFQSRPIGDSRIEVIQSLAKWKRLALHKYGFNVGKGLISNMKALRPNEEIDELHSIYVDQWDWEKRINKGERNEIYLKSEVVKIYQSIKDTADYLSIHHNHSLVSELPNQIHFVTAQELEDQYPNCSPKEREFHAAKKNKAIFIMKIGGEMKSGLKHEQRAPDYDDWSLNGDLILWSSVLSKPVEISSMGIRVSDQSLKQQLLISGCSEWSNLEYHHMILNGGLLDSIGGGIGQSRLCMFLLNLLHVGEVHVSEWPLSEIEKNYDKDIAFL